MAIGEPAEAQATSASATIGLLLHGVLSRPYAGSVLSGAQDAAASHRAAIVLMHSGLGQHRTEPRSERLLAPTLAGAIVASDGASTTPDPQNLGSVPHVRLNTSGPATPNCTVVADHLQGARSVIYELMQAGHRRIGYAGARAVHGAPDAWVRGVAQALLDADMFDPSLIFSDLPNAEGGRRSALQALRRADAATALVCFNGRVAMGVYQAAHEVYVKIPGELSVVALDDAEVNAEDLRPPLTTLHIPHYEMAQQAVHSLFTLLDDLSEPAPAVKIACRIVHRESS